MISHLLLFKNMDTCKKIANMSSHFNLTCNGYFCHTLYNAYIEGITVNLYV